jgi:hypothetical protein
MPASSPIICGQQGRFAERSFTNLSCHLESFYTGGGRTKLQCCRTISTPRSFVCCSGTESSLTRR